MPVMNFDLEDGLPPVSFSLKTVDCDRFMKFMAECQAIKDSPKPAHQEPVFWYRPCSNGMYEGPIHNAQIERVRKESGAWHPLYTSPPAQRKPLTEKIKDEFWVRAIQHGKNGQSMNWQAAADFYANAIEAAHGIKENTQLSKPLLEPDYYVYNIDGQYRLADPQPTIKWGNKC